MLNNNHRSDKSLVSAFVDSLGKKRIIEILGELIKIPTVNPPGINYDIMAKTLENILKKIGMGVEIHQVRSDVLKKYNIDSNNPRFIVLARIGSGRPILHFNSHYDVVPAGKGWKRDPFQLTIDNDTIYGRGVVDMKGGMTATIVAAHAAIMSNIALNGTLELSFTPDEESGGETGVGYMLKAGLVNPDYVVVAEPSGINNIWIGNKGTVKMEIEIIGKQAHASTPWLGLNAFEGMVELSYPFIYKTKLALENKYSKYTFLDSLQAKPTINIGGIVEGGVGMNVVPGSCKFTIDRRLIPEENTESVIDDISKTVKLYSLPLEEEGYRVLTRVISKSEPSVASPKSRLVNEMKKAIKKVIKKDPLLTICQARVDTAYFQAKNIQAVTYGPGDDNLAHTADEKSSLTDILIASKVYSQLISQLLFK